MVLEKILIFGISSTLGKALVEQLKCKYELFGTFNSNSILFKHVETFKYSINDLNVLPNILNELKPNYIISTLRGDFDNLVLFHEKLAESIKREARLYFCSSGSVFDKNPYRAFYEDDEPVAESDYGKNKIACEKVLLSKLNIDNNLCILRFAQIFDLNSPRITEIIGKIKNNEIIEINSNLIQNRTSATMLAKQIMYLIDNGHSGIRHLGSIDVITDEDFYTDLFRKITRKEVSMKIISLPKEFYIGTLRKEELFPNYLKFTNMDLIDYLEEEIGIIE